MKAKLIMMFLFALLAGTLPSISGQLRIDPANGVIEQFISCHVNADAKILKEILRDDAVFKIPRQNKVINQTKNELGSQMRQEKGVVQNCSSSYQILTRTSSLVIARVDFNYPQFLVSNFLTIENDGSDNWKITAVAKNYNVERNGGQGDVITVF